MSDANHIAHNIWQGSAPRTPEVQANLHRQFDVLVLTAEEYQPPAASFPGVEVIHAGFDDSGQPMKADEFRLASAASAVVADRVRAGYRVLVTCWQGRNRSGLVTALALHRLTGAPGKECMRTVQERRPQALTNRYFQRALEKLPRRSPPHRRSAPRAGTGAQRRRGG